MLPLTVLFACATVLVIPASAAPLQFDPSSELQQPNVVLVASPEQAFTADSLHASSASARGRVRRGTDFRAADYAVNVATAVKTAVPTQATPVILPAAAPTNGAALSRRHGFTHGSGYFDDKTRRHHDEDEMIVPAAYAATPSPVTLVDLASVPDNESDSSTEKPAVDLAGVNTALVHPDTTPSGPGPETRPKFTQAKQTLSQSQSDDGAPVTTPPQVGGSAVLAQVDAANAPVVTINKTPGDVVPQVAGPASHSSRPAVQYKIGTANIESTSRRERRGPGPLRLSRRLSGSSLYRGSEASHFPINPRAAEADSLPVVKPAPRAAFVKNLEKRQNVSPNVPVNAQVPPVFVGARKARVSKARTGAAPERSDGTQGLDTNGEMQNVGKLAEATPRLSAGA